MEILLINASLISLRFSKKNGFSLLELLISICLCSFLITLLCEQYLKVKFDIIKARQKTDVNSEVLLISEHLRQMIRTAGFTPCAPLKDLPLQDKRLTPQGLLSQFSMTNAPNQRLTFSKMGEPFYKIRQISQKTVWLTALSCPKIARPILIADCLHAEVHDVLGCQHLRKGVLLRLGKTPHFEVGQDLWLGPWVEESLAFEKDSKGFSVFYYIDRHRDKVSKYLTIFEGRLLSIKHGLCLEWILGSHTMSPLLFQTRFRMS